MSRMNILFLSFAHRM